MKKFKYLITIILFFNSSLYSSELYQKTKIIMGTYISIKLPSENKKYLEDAFGIFKELDSKLSVFKESSEISKLNKEKKINPSATITDILKKSVAVCKETNGFFNIAVGALTIDEYGFGTESEKIPDNERIKEIKEFLKCDLIKFKKDHIEIPKNIKVDLGGIGKGYAVDKVHKFLKEKNINRGVISASGDIRCLDICKIYIKDPFNEENLAYFTTLKGGVSISTSGIYERYIHSKDLNHIINPKTGYPQNKITSVTLIWDRGNTLLDAYATAVSVMPLQKSLDFLINKKIGFILVTDDKKVYYSKDIFRYVKDLIFLKSKIEVINY